MILNLGLRFCLFVVLLTIFPAQADDISSELTDARNIFLQGVDGDKSAVRNAVNRFRSLSQRHPETPIYIAYLGASITLQGRDAPNGIDKQRLTEEGLDEIDRALELFSHDNDEPSSRRLDTLLVAANSFIYIPSFFNRYERGKRLLREILEHNDFKEMAAGFKAAAYFTAALIARGDGDENEYHRYLNLTVNTDPQGRDGRFASELLEEL